MQTACLKHVKGPPEVQVVVSAAAAHLLCSHPTFATMMSRAKAFGLRTEIREETSAEQMLAAS